MQQVIGDLLPKKGFHAIHVQAGRQRRKFALLLSKKLLHLRAELRDRIGNQPNRDEFTPLDVAPVLDPLADRAQPANFQAFLRLRSGAARQFLFPRPQIWQQFLRIDARPAKPRRAFALQPPQEILGHAKS